METSCKRCRMCSVSWVYVMTLCLFSRKISRQSKSYRPESKPGFAVTSVLVSFHYSMQFVRGMMEWISCNRRKNAGYYKICVTICARKKPIWAKKPERTSGPSFGGISKNYAISYHSVYQIGTRRGRVVMGRVYWLTGLTGVGKTTIAAALREELSSRGVSAILIDGDVMRRVLGKDLDDYAREDRLKLAMFYARLCHMLSIQGFTVICATISLFRNVQDWNRRNISNYIEVLVVAPHPILLARRQKNLCADNQMEQSEHIVGVDIDPEFPETPDIKIVNDGKVSLRRIALSICQ